MMPGMPPGCPFGKPGDVQYLPLVYFFQGTVAVTVRPRIGCGGYFCVMCDGVVIGHRLCPDNRDTVFIGPYNAEHLDHHISSIPFGVNTQPAGYFTDQHTQYQATHAERILTKTTVAPELYLVDYGTTFSGVSITGARRLVNIERTNESPLMGRWILSVTAASGTMTVTLTANGVVVASGSAATGIAVNLPLAEVNGSGVSGTVNVDYTADATATVYARWPAKVNQYYDPGTVNTSGAEKGFAPDDGYSNTLSHRSARLTPGAYQVATRLVDEGGNKGAASTPIAVTVPGPPEPPGQPAYVSGGSTGTVIGWSPSSTAGATYNIYDSGAVNPAMDTLGWLDLDAPTASTANTQFTLPDCGGGYTGIRRVLVRALNGTWEEGNSQILDLEYADGVRVPPRPNSPFSTVPPVVSGRTLTVRYVYHRAGEKAAPAQFALYLIQPNSPSEIGLPTLVNAPADGSMGDNSSVAGVITGTISITSDSNRICKYCLRAISAEGAYDRSSDILDTVIYGPVILFAGTPAAPVGVDVSLGY